MNAALFLIIGCAVLVVGYIFYGGWPRSGAWITPVRLLPIPWRMARIIVLPRLPC